MNNHNVDLYRALGLDPGDDSDSLRILLSGRDAQLEAAGYPPQHPDRQQVQTAFAVLGDPASREQYDAALAQQRPMAWHEVEHLGNFGRFPQAQFQQPTHTPPGFPDPASPPLNFANPSYATPAHVQSQQNPFTVPGERPPAGTRLGMLLLDGLFVTALSGAAAAIFIWSDVLVALVGVLVMLLYFIGFEIKTGATPAKHIFGYEVRDVKTGQKPSIEQSAKRQWWRFVGLIPGVGGLIAFIGMIVIGSSISPDKEYRGSHDRWAGTEVAKKPGR